MDKRKLLADAQKCLNIDEQEIECLFQQLNELKDVVNARYGGSLLVSQWCFLLDTPCSKAYGE
jgi:hypothetical protein